jgi:hypothetical protein
MNFQCYQSNKRQRNVNVNVNVYAIPIISQDDQEEAEEDSMMDLSTSSPPAKRFRPCHEDFAMSPGIVSVVDILDSTDCSSSTAMETCAVTKKPVEWWKQASEKQKRQKNLPMLLGENDSECYVCGSVYTEKVDVTKEASSPSQNVMPTNSLLAYFSCKSTSAALQRKALPNSKPSNTETTCTFCERSTCLKCLEKCEECRKPFCTFCLKNDYLGAIARVVCLDCSGDDDHDAMKL